MNLKDKRKSQNIRSLIGQSTLPPIDPKARAKQQITDLFNRNEINPRIDDPGMIADPRLAAAIARNIQDVIRKRRK